MDGKKLIELKQERATLTTSIRALMTEYEAKELPGDKKTEMTKMEARFDEINASVLTEEKQLGRERAIGEGLNKDDKKVDAKSAEVMAAFCDHMINGSAETLRVYNALQQDNPAQAGYLMAPMQFVDELIKELADATFMRQKGRVLPPLKGAQSLGYPQQTAGMSSFAWGTEIAAPTPDASLAFGRREFKPRPATSLILVSNTLMRNAPNTDGIVRAAIAEEDGAQLETAYMTGDGANKPLGLFTASVDGIPVARDVSTGNSATEIKFDGLLNAKYSVKDKYQARCEWVLHRLGVLQIATLKDGNGQYIWQPSVVLGTPDMLLGKPVNMSEYAPSTFTTGLYVGVYGDLKQYWIADSLGMEIKVLSELYALTNQIAYISRLETDGAPIMPAAFARVKLA